MANSHHNNNNNHRITIFIYSLFNVNIGFHCDMNKWFLFECKRIWFLARFSFMSSIQANCALQLWIGALSLILCLYFRKKKINKYWQHRPIYVLCSAKRNTYMVMWWWSWMLLPCIYIAILFKFLLRRRHNFLIPFRVVFYDSKNIILLWLLNIGKMFSFFPKLLYRKWDDSVHKDRGSRCQLVYNYALVIDKGLNACTESLLLLVKLGFVVVDFDDNNLPGWIMFNEWNMMMDECKRSAESVQFQGWLPN